MCDMVRVDTEMFVTVVLTPGGLYFASTLRSSFPAHVTFFVGDTWMDLQRDQPLSISGDLFGSQFVEHNSDLRQSRLICTSWQHVPSNGSCSYSVFWQKPTSVSQLFFCDSQIDEEVQEVDDDAR